MKSEKIVPPYNHEGYEQLDSYTDEDEADRKILRQLVEMGSDLSKERHSIHYFYFESKVGAQAAGLELEKMNFEVQVGEMLEEEPSSRRWPVTADRTEVINEAVIRALRDPFVEIAKSHGGEYDGWEAQHDRQALG